MARLAIRLHAAAQRLLPAATRARLGAQLTDVFDQQLDEARRLGGRLAVARLTARELTALLRFAWRERRDAPRAAARRADLDGRRPAGDPQHDSRLRPGPPFRDPPAVAQPRLRGRVHRHHRAGHRRQYRHLQRRARGDAEGAALCRPGTAGRPRPPHQRRRCARQHDTRQPLRLDARRHGIRGDGWLRAHRAHRLAAGRRRADSRRAVGRAAVRGAGPPGGRGPGAQRRRRRSRRAAGGRAQRAAGPPVVRRYTARSASR